jgi:hypothetical protein
MRQPFAFFYGETRRLTIFQIFWSDVASYLSPASSHQKCLTTFKR